MWWAYFHCYQLTLDVHSQSTQQVSTNLPTVVYNLQQNCIVQCDSAALKSGLDINMGLAQAASLCPDITIIDYCADTELSALNALAHNIYQVASDVVILPPTGIAVRLDNLLQYYGSYPVLWHALTHEFTQANISRDFGVAWGIEAAKVLAKHKNNRFYTTHQQVKSALQNCNLSLCELSDKTRSALNRVGISAVGPLLAMPVQAIGQRFHNDVIRYLTALRGETFPTVTLFRPKETFASHITLPFEAENTQHLLPYIKSLLTRLEHYLRARNLLTSSIHFTIGFRESDNLDLGVSAAHTMVKVMDWQLLVELALSSKQLPEPAISIHLTCDSFDDVSPEDDDFFSQRFSLLAQKQLLGRLYAKLGDEGNTRVLMGNDHRIEKMTSHQSVTSVSEQSAAYSPAFLFDKPTPLTTPSRICFGPLRINTGWWDNNTYQRDYFIVETHQEHRLLVFRDANEQWWSQGVYS